MKSLSTEQLRNINTVYYLIDTHTFKKKNHHEYGYRHKFTFIDYISNYVLSFRYYKYYLL